MNAVFINFAERKIERERRGADDDFGSFPAIASPGPARCSPRINGAKEYVVCTTSVLSSIRLAPDFSPLAQSWLGGNMAVLGHDLSVGGPINETIVGLHGLV